MSAPSKFEFDAETIEAIVGLAGAAIVLIALGLIFGPWVYLLLVGLVMFIWAASR